MTTKNMENIDTIEQAQRFQDQLDELSQQLFKVNVSVMEELDAVFSETEKDSFIAACEKEQADITNVSAVQKVVENLQKSIKEMPKLEIQIAVTPTEYIVKTISSWVETNTDGKRLLDISVNEKLIGGAAVSVNGLYRDHSVSKMLETIKI